MKKLNLLFALLAAGAFSQAQLTVNNNLTADEVVQLLVGPDVTFSNVTFSGGSNQKGSFDATTAILGTTSGVMLASGDIANGIGPNTNCCSSLGGGFFGATDPDIDQLDPGFSHNDAAILEFDFVATGTQVDFKYIWASEEYPEFSGAGDGCGNVSDVFGFFVSGPGINGPFSNAAENIALIPGTSVFVSIFNLNASCTGLAVPGDPFCNYCEYYVHNGIGGDAPYATDDQYVQYDGFTTLLTATANLECGETYHIKLVLADASDTAWDSAVFLEEGSFNVSGAPIVPLVVNPAPGLPELTLLEGCVEGQFIITPPNCSLEADTIQLDYSGSAGLNIDYITSNPTQIIVIPGEEATINITVPGDDLVEGNETIEIQFTFINNLGDLDTAFAVLTIQDYTPPVMNPLANVFICNDDVDAVASATAGYPPYQYTWSTGQTGATETFTEGQAGTYSVTVVDYCEGSDSTTVIVEEPEPFVQLEDTLSLVCLGSEIAEFVEGGQQPYEYTYTYNDTVYSLENLSFIGQFVGEFTIDVIDQCGEHADLYVVVDNCNTVIPNIFTPNQDGENDTFQIFGIQGFPGSQLLIYNRWGEKVFESPNYNNSWNGEEFADGVYYYIFNRTDGKSWEGYFHLVRGK